MPIDQPNGPAVFPIAEVLDRDWGQEVILVATEFYTLKHIVMNPDTCGGLQYHHKKDESGIARAGWATVEYDKGNGKLVRRTLLAGECFRFPQGAVHRVTAGRVGFEYIEASTPHLNDRCHCEKDYGLEEETGGLPSTTPEDVVTIPKGAGLAK